MDRNRTVSATLPYSPSISLSASPQTLSVLQGGASQTSTITATINDVNSGSLTFFRELGLSGLSADLSGTGTTRTFTISSGTASPGTYSIPVTATGTGTNGAATSASPIAVSVTVGANGACSQTRFQCSSGTSANNVTNGAVSTWDCLGSNGGTNASCSQTMSGALSATSCTIASGASAGNSTISWQTVNPQATSAVTSDTDNSGNSAPNTPVASGNCTSGCNSSVPVTYPSRNFWLYNNANLLASASASCACVTGTAWNGNTCAPTALPSGSISATSCEIASGASTCSSLVTWSTANLTAATTEVTRNNPDNTHVSWAISGTNVTNNVNYGSSTFYLYHNNAQLASSGAISATCISGTQYVSGVCTPIPTASISVNPGSVSYGGSSNITWSSTNSTSCMGSGDWSGTKAASGGEGTGSLTISKTYTITCSGAGGQSAPASASVTVGSSTPSPDLTAGSATPITATVGTPLTFSATVFNNGGAGTGASFSNFFQRATAAGGGGTKTDFAPTTMATLGATGSGSDISTATSPSYIFSSAGTYSVRACADGTSSAGGGVISESNENNNCGPWTDVTVTTIALVNGSCTQNHYFCDTGTSVNNVDGATAWTWNCNGSGGGTNTSCTEQKPVINGSCSATHYNCAAGTSANNGESQTAWTWTCQGSQGGTNASCSESKLIKKPIFKEL